MMPCFESKNNTLFKNTHHALNQEKKSELLIRFAILLSNFMIKIISLSKDSLKKAFMSNIKEIKIPIKFEKKYENPPRILDLSNDIILFECNCTNDLIAENFYIFDTSNNIDRDFTS